MDYITGSPYTPHVPTVDVPNDKAEGYDFGALSATPDDTSTASTPTPTGYVGVRN